MKDYAQTLVRIQKGLGKSYIRSATILGIPGVSVAVKLDPQYYVAVMPAFLSRIAQWSGMFPDVAEQTLVHTGNIIVSGPNRQSVLPLTLTWAGGATSRRVNASFILAEFIDSSLRMYGKRPDPMPVADIRVDAKDQASVDAFFKDKTTLDKTAFTQQS